MDATAINEMDGCNGARRGEYFDYATTDSDSVLNMLQKITNAGHDIFCLLMVWHQWGMKGVKPWK